MVYPRLARSLASYCGDVGLGRDYAQEALARAWERWDRVSLMDAPAMWVYRTGLNLARSQARRRASEQRALAKARAASAGSFLPEPAWVDAIAVRAAIVRLPARQREAVVLRYHADMSVGDTATVMRCAPGTVKALTQQALTRLRDEFGVDEQAARA